MKTVLLSLLFLFVCALAPRVQAADNLFNSGAAIKEEASRVAEEGKLFVKGPIEYLPATAAVAGAFALTYAFDKDIRSDVSGIHSGTLTSITDFANTAGNPLVHIGVTAALYTAGAAADAPGVMSLAQEMGEALFLADGSTYVLRQAIGRGRPETGKSNSRYRPFQFKKDYDSLPSMHTASSFALAHVFAAKTESIPAKVLCYAAAGFVGFSRIYDNKHWASDVVLGAAIGELAGNAVTRFYGLKKAGLTVAPMAVDGTPALALIGKF